MKRSMLGAVGTALGGALVYALSTAIADAGTVAAKWSQRTQAAAGDYTSGVQNTASDPTALAIAAGQRYIQRVTDAFNSGKWANSLRRVGKAGWQSATLAKAANFATGVAASEQKVANAFTPLLAYEATLQSRIDSMPDVTAADRKARMNAWFDGMSQYQAPA
jgi:hypothetical protein